MAPFVVLNWSPAGSVSSAVNSVSPANALSVVTVSEARVKIVVVTASVMSQSIVTM